MTQIKYLVDITDPGKGIWAVVHAPERDWPWQVRATDRKRGLDTTYEFDHKPEAVAVCAVLNYLGVAA